MLEWVREEIEREASEIQTGYTSSPFDRGRRSGLIRALAIVEAAQGEIPGGVEVPPVVSRYLEAHGLVAVAASDLTQASKDACPFPLHDSGPFGRTHVSEVGEVCGLSVLMCEACGNVTFEKPVLFGGAPS